MSWKIAEGVEWRRSTLYSLKNMSEITNHQCPIPWEFTQVQMKRRIGWDISTISCRLQISFVLICLWLWGNHLFFCNWLHYLGSTHALNYLCIRGGISLLRQDPCVAINMIFLGNVIPAKAFTRLVWYGFLWLQHISNCNVVLHFINIISIGGCKLRGEVSFYSSPSVSMSKL